MWILNDVTLHDGMGLFSWKLYVTITFNRNVSLSSLI
jgi:hypothetical protein